MKQLGDENQAQRDLQIQLDGSKSRLRRSLYKSAHTSMMELTAAAQSEHERVKELCRLTANKGGVND